MKAAQAGCKQGKTPHLRYCTGHIENFLKTQPLREGEFLTSLAGTNFSHTSQTLDHLWIDSFSESSESRSKFSCPRKRLLASFSQRFTSPRGGQTLTRCGFAMPAS
jgi:hypothetical protein